VAGNAVVYGAVERQQIRNAKMEQKTKDDIRYAYNVIIGIVMVYLAIKMAYSFGKMHICRTAPLDTPIPSWVIMKCYE